MKYIGLSIISCVLMLSCRQEVLPVLSQVQEISNLPVNDILFVNNQDGYAVGGLDWPSGFISSTHDGGKTWQTDSLVTSALLSLHMGKDSTIYAVGFVGNFYYKRPHQGWQYYRVNNYNVFRDICSVDDGLLICTGESYKEGKLIKLNHDFQIVALDSVGNEMDALAVVNKNDVAAVGFGTSFYSKDSGNSWNQSALTGDFFTDMSAAPNGTLYAIGFNGTFISSNNAGKSWQTLYDRGQFKAKLSGFESLFIKDDNTMYIAGRKGALWRTTDAGKNWSVFRCFTNQNLYGLTCRGDEIWVGAEDGSLFKILD